MSIGSIGVSELHTKLSTSHFSESGVLRTFIPYQFSFDFFFFLLYIIIILRKSISIFYKEIEEKNNKKIQIITLHKMNNIHIVIKSIFKMNTTFLILKKNDILYQPTNRMERKWWYKLLSAQSLMKDVYFVQLPKVQRNGSERVLIWI